MTKHEARVLTDVIKEIAAQAKQLSEQGSRMNTHILKHGQVADSEWNEMWHDEGQSAGLLKAADLLTNALRELIEAAATKPDA